jgi:hypothetical protein
LFDCQSQLHRTPLKSGLRVHGRAVVDDAKSQFDENSKLVALLLRADGAVKIVCIELEKRER